MSGWTGTGRESTCTLEEVRGLGQRPIETHDRQCHTDGDDYRGVRTRRPHYDESSPAFSNPGDGAILRNISLLNDVSELGHGSHGWVGMRGRTRIHLLGSLPPEPPDTHIMVRPLCRGLYICSPQAPTRLFPKYGHVPTCVSENTSFIDMSWKHTDSNRPFGRDNRHVSPVSLRYGRLQARRR